MIENNAENTGANRGGDQPVRKLPSIRSSLTILFMVCLLPSLAGLGSLLFYFYESGRTQLERDDLQTARALTTAVDRDLGIGENVALALATSRNLQMNDLAAFHAQAQSLLLSEFPGFTFVLSDESGQQLVNAIRPFGEPLPQHGNPEQLRQVFETGKPVISDVFVAGVLRRPIISIDVPVWRDGKIVYDLAVGFLPERLGRILTEQRLPPDRIVSIFDSVGVNVARTPSPEKFVGRKATPELIQRILEATDGVMETVTLDGIPVVTAFHRSSTTGWAVAIGTPKAAIFAELLQSLLFTTLIVAALLASGFGTAWILGGRISRSIRALVAPALALGDGSPVALPPGTFREAVEVAKALKMVAGELDCYRISALRQHEELARAKADADRASLAKSKFLAAASHDLRQPVQSLVLFLSVLKAHATTPVVEKAANAMENALEGLNALLSSILDISRIDAGVVAPQMQSVDIDGLVRRLCAEYAPLCDQKGLRLRCRSRLGLHARADAALLERIIRNLIENAICYTHRGGLLIGTRRRGDRLRIDVMDTGIGIPADKLPNIYEEFYQVANSARDARQGLGLGLSIVSRLAKLIGAEVLVRSNEGRGTCFSVLLPLGAPGRKVSSPSVLAEVLTRQRIMVIEDNPTIRVGLQLMLEGWNCEVISAETGEEALEIGEREGWLFDAIIADHRLGTGLTGTDTAAEFRRRSGQPIPTVIVTGDTAPERIEEVHASGFEMMHKPVTPDELARKLARLLSEQSVVSAVQ